MVSNLVDASLKPIRKLFGVDGAPRIAPPDAEPPVPGTLDQGIIQRENMLRRRAGAAGEGTGGTLLTRVRDQGAPGQRSRATTTGGG